MSLSDARTLIEAWRRDYNEGRPHTSLGGLTPTEFAARWQDIRADKTDWLPDASFGSYQAVNLVADAAGNVYLLGFETALPGDDLVELYAVDLAQPPEKLLRKLASKRIELSGDNHFISGAGLRIDGGRLSFLATQRNLAPRTKITLGR